MPDQSIVKTDTKLKAQSERQSEFRLSAGRRSGPALVAVVAAFAVCLGAGSASQAQAKSASEAQPYFWPDHLTTITYKMKSHAMRGTMTLNAGREVKIGDHVYRELTASARRVRAPHKVVYQRADQQGLYARFSESPTAPETLMLKLPARAGEHWKTVNDNGEPSERSVQKIGPCKVRGNAFSQCVTVGFESNGFPAIAVFVPEYGEVVNSQVNGFVHRELSTK